VTIVQMTISCYRRQNNQHSLTHNGSTFSQKRCNNGLCWSITHENMSL